MGAGHTGPIIPGVQVELVTRFGCGNLLAMLHGILVGLGQGSSLHVSQNFSLIALTVW